MKPIFAGSIAAGLLLGLAGAAQADSKSASFNVSATVAKACAISAANLDMSTWGGTGDLDGSSKISVKCTTGTLFDVALNAGTNSAGSFAPRKLADGAELLSYNLYTDADRSQVWGETVGTNTQGGTGTGMATANEQDLTVYARVALADLQAAKPGTYTDVVTATVTY